MNWRKKLYAKVFGTLLLRPLTKFRRRWRLYWTVSRRYQRLLEKSASTPANVGKNVEKLNTLRDLKDHYHSYFYLIAWFAFLVAGVIAYRILGADVSYTSVTADIRVTDIRFRHVEKKLFEDESSIVCQGNAVFNNVMLEGDSTSLGQYELIPQNQSKLYFSFLSFPESSLTRITWVRSGNLNLTITPSRHDLASGMEIRAQGSMVSVRNPAGKPIYQLLAEGSPRQFVNQINVTPITVDLDSVDQFRLRNLVVQSLEFVDEPPLQQERRSSVLGGFVRLNDVKGDSIMIREGDVVKIKPTDHVKLNIEADSTSIRIRLQGLVTQLDVGAGDYEQEKSISRMPSVFKKLYVSNDFILTILGAVLAAVFPYLFRQKRQL